MLNTIPTLQFLTDNTEGTSSRRQQRQQNTIDYEQQQSHRQWTSQTQRKHKISGTGINMNITNTNWKWKLTQVHPSIWVLGHVEMKVKWNRLADCV